MIVIKIKNWSSLQSYKDRQPPWIRFHKKILDDFEFHSMSAEARAWKNKNETVWLAIIESANQQLSKHERGLFSAFAMVEAGI